MEPLTKGVKGTYYVLVTHLEKYFSVFNNTCYCSNVAGLFQQLGYKHDHSEWRLFIDSSKLSLKAVLLHNGNEKPSVPLVHAVGLKETYKSMETILQLIKYSLRNWNICGDLKAIG